jgi:hypothetical protein
MSDWQTPIIIGGTLIAVGGAGYLIYKTLNEGEEKMDFSAIQRLLDSIPALLQTIEELKSKAQDAESLVVVEKQASYDAGFAAGLASVAEKIYTQADLDGAVALAVEPLTAELILIKGEFETLKMEVDSKIEIAKGEAVAMFKAELKAKYDEAQATETELELAIGEMLK